MATAKLGTPRGDKRTPLFDVTYPGITSAEPVAVYRVPAGSAIKLVPTSAGTATVYSSSSDQDKVAMDVASGNAAVIAGTNAKYDQWTAGAVTAATLQVAVMPQTAVVVVVTSGTWTLEVVTP